MKLLFSLIILGFLLAVKGAVTPGHALRRGGSSHLSAIRNAAKGHFIRNKPHSAPGNHTGMRNGALRGHHASNRNLRSGYASSTLTAVAPYRSQGKHSKSHYLHRRNSILVHDYRSVSMRLAARLTNNSNVYAGSRTASGASRTHVKGSKATRTLKRSPLNTAPTPAPTAAGSPDTTVHINNENDFALLLPKTPGELISDAEEDGVSFCTLGGCSNTLPEGFITAAAVTKAPDAVSWIQVTGCIDPSKASLSASDEGGQFDVRFPNGAQCTFGGYGASFIEQVEPASRRFCLRCCAAENDQTNCNSHQDRAGCVIAVPGIYDFPDRGVSCG